MWGGQRSLRVAPQVEEVETAAATPPAPRVKPPSPLTAKTAPPSSQAHAELDFGKKDAAKATPPTVVKEPEDVKLATIDLDERMQQAPRRTRGPR